MIEYIPYWKDEVVSGTRFYEYLPRHADWPNVCPTSEPATNRVYRGAGSPVPPGPAVPQGSAEPPDFLPSAVVVSRHSDAVTPPTWEVVHDVLAGRSAVRLHEVREERIDGATVVGREYMLTTEVDQGRSGPGERARPPRQPHLAPERRRAGGFRVSIQAAATHFHVTIDLEVTVNGALYYSTRWVESVLRAL